MLGMGEITDWDRRTRLRNAKQVLFLIDACFSGLAAPQTQADLQSLAIRQLARYGHDLVTAATQGEQTIASDRWSGSIFTDALIRGAEGAADQPIRIEENGVSTVAKDGVVSLSELISYVRTQVNLEANDAGWPATITPRLTPLSASNEGEFFFITEGEARKEGRLSGPGADCGP